MRDGHRLFDADRHVLEPFEMWKEHLPAALHDEAPYLGEGSDGPVPMVRGEPIWRTIAPRARAVLARAGRDRREALAAGATADGQLAAMDRDGIDAAVLFPTVGLFLMGIDALAPHIAGAYARAYNDWLRGLCRRDPARLRGAGLISPHDPSQMAAEVARVTGFGFGAVVLRPNPIGGRTLGHPDYAPFWAECERRSLAVVIHEGAHARAPSAGADRFTSRFALHACSHPMEQMMALLALLEGGVLERHPRLRVGFLEAGCGWLPYWLFRLDEEHEHLAAEVESEVRMAPSAYFRRQCFAAFEPGEPGLAEVVRYVGEDNLLFGTDFPHLDHRADVTEAALGLRGVVSEGALGKMLGGNAERFYGGAPRV